MFLHLIEKKDKKSICDIRRTGSINGGQQALPTDLPNMRKQRKSLNNQGFTLFELIIVIALIAILLGVATVGISGYFKAADQLERFEIAETSFYSIQSHVNYLERHGKLEEFEEEIRSYNRSVYGQERILSTSENRSIIELNYDGGDGAAFYENEYYPDHKESEIIYITLDKDRADSNHPIYDVLASALDNKEAMENSFLVEYDLSTGVVRSVFYSETANSLTYNFGNGNAAGSISDCIYRNPDSLVDKEQGYYGVTFTAVEVELKVQELLVPVEVNLVNEDRLYLTWAEENTNNQSFINGSMQYEELVYTVTLYNQNDDVVATYELPRADMYEDNSGTFAGTLDYIDDYSEPVSDILVGSTKTARIGYSDLAYTEAPTGIAGEYYFLLLECLDHPFGDNGYEFAPETVLYATVEVSYGLDGGFSADEIVESNEESAYYAHVKNESGAQEFGVAYSRHLWNIRNGLYDGDYRLIADVDWANIENRARDIDFTSTQFADALIPGMYQSFEGTFTGEKTGEEAQSGANRYSNYLINGVSIFEEGNEKVGLFTINNGTIENITLSNFVISGANKTGSLAGWNVGSMKNICVLDTSVKGTEEVGGLTGYNEGTIEGCTVTTGENRIIAHHTVGGVVGYAKNSVTDCQTACKVETILPEGTDKISTSKLGRYAGGVIGYLEAGMKATGLISGLLVDAATGLPMAQKASGADGGATEGTKLLCSDVTAIAYMGGVIGEIEAGAGEYTNLANYAKLNVTYVDAAERSARSDSGTRMYEYYGGITGRLYAGNSLKNCTNYAVVALDFIKDGQPCDPAEIYSYVDQVPANNDFYNNPRYVGGITGHNKGTVQDCVSACDDYGTFEEAMEEYQTVRKEGAYIGAYVGGLVGYNEATVLLTDALPVDTMQVVVKAFCLSNGGLVGYSKTGASVRNESGMLTIQGVVASRGSEHPQQHQTVNAFESTGGVIGQVKGGEFTGEYTNDAYILGMNAGGITAYLAKGLSLSNCHNTGIIYGRGSLRGHAEGATGGIAGYNHGTLLTCSNTGIVSGTNYMKDVPASSEESHGYRASVGGVAGYNTGTVKNCHSTLNKEQDNYIAADISSNAGGLVAYNNLGVVETDTREVVDIPIVVGAIKGSYGTRVGGIVGHAQEKLTLKDFTYAGKIHVKAANAMPNNGTGGIIGAMENKNHILTGCVMDGSIDSAANRTGGLTGYMSNGVIDNTNEVTSNAVIKGDRYTGGVVGMHNVSNTIQSSHVDVMENKAKLVSGEYYVGGIAGYVYTADSIDLSNRKNSGEVIGDYYVGGLAGYYRMADLVEIGNLENTGKVTGYRYVGGMIGSLSSSAATISRTIQNSTNKGIINYYSGSNSYGQCIGGIVGLVETQAVFENCVNDEKIGPREESDKGYDIGGIVGRTKSSTQITNCKNKADIDGTCYVGGILGFTNAADNVEIENCINEKQTHLVATNNTVGGILGRADGTTVKNCYLTVKDCFNYGYLDCPTISGGIAGQINNLEMAISDCTNYGEIGACSEGKWTIDGAGGIAGKTNVKENSVIENCVQNANINQLNRGGFGRGIGGILGWNEKYLTIEDCTAGDENTQYTLNVVGKTAYIGGVAGGTWGGRLTFLNCQNYLNMEGDADILQAGGLLGYSTSKVIIGKEGDPASYCNSYGDFNVTGTINSCGGMIGYGYGGSDFEIYGSTNYGMIGKNASAVAGCGGMIGDLNGAFNSTGVLIDCTQLGNIYQAIRTAGGLIGNNNQHSLTITNCQNGDSAEPNKEKGNVYAKNSASGAGPYYIGGLIGYSAASTEGRYLTMLSSNNYGTIQLTNNVNPAIYIGGLIGSVGTYNITIGDEMDAALACCNYGDIIGEDLAELRYGGGLIGQCNPRGKNGSLHMYGAVNYGSITDIQLFTCVGGLIGIVEKPGLLQNCQNLGTLSAGRKIQYVGGMIGRSLTSYPGLVLDNCVNGSLEDENAGTITADSIAGVGGMVGDTHDYLSTGRDELITLNNCVNYADMVGKQSVNNTGGMIGLGDTDGLGSRVEAYSCKNYGDIYADTVNPYTNQNNQYENNVGGIAGHLGMYAVLDTCENYGKIAKGTVPVNGAGGIVGAAGHSASVTGVDITIQNCINYAEIVYGVGEYGYIINIGGIAGQVNAGIEPKLCLVVNCINNGRIGTDEFNKNGREAHIGGIAGTGSGTIKNCQNLGTLHASGTSIGGILGCSSIHSKEVTISDCINGSADASENIAISIKGQSQQIGGIVGYSNTGDYDKKIQISDCINYADINLQQGKYNAHVGGIFGTMYNYNANSNTQDPSKRGIHTLEIVNCENYGDINNAFHSVGGIIGNTAISTANDYTVSRCINHGDISVDNTYQEQSSSQIGGICGYAKSSGKIIHCINEGNITNARSKVGGLVGEMHNAYLMDCYHIGSISSVADSTTVKDLIGYVNADNNNYMQDCYSFNKNCSLLAAENAEYRFMSIWQATGDSRGYGYLNQDIYNALCSIFGVASAWSGDILANTIYLTENYKYNPDSLSTPELSDFEFIPRYVPDISDVNTRYSSYIRWKVISGNYLSSGMEVYLYDTSMTNEEIEEDTDGSEAYFKGTAEFASGLIPGTVSVIFPDEQLPEEETTYKVAVKILGYRTDDILTENGVITEDSEMKVEGEIVLPGVTATTSTFSMNIGDEDSEVEEETIVDEIEEDEETTEEGVTEEDEETTEEDVTEEDEETTEEGITEEDEETTEEDVTEEDEETTEEDVTEEGEEATEGDEIEEVIEGDGTNSSVSANTV